MRRRQCDRRRLYGGLTAGCPPCRREGVRSGLTLGRGQRGVSDGRLSGERVRLARDCLHIRLGRGRAVILALFGGFVAMTRASGRAENV